MEELKQEIKELIIEALVLEDVTPEEIDSDEPIFEEGLGLDSIDALELAMAVEERYGVRFNAEDENNRIIFASVTNLARHIAVHRTDVPRG
jgi:acyl carrier protein